MIIGQQQAQAEVIPERRSTAQSTRALAELDDLLKGSRDRDAVLARLGALTRAFVDKATARGGGGRGARGAPPEPAAAPQSPPASPEGHRWTTMASIPATEDLMGVADPTERLRRLRALRETRTPAGTRPAPAALVAAAPPPRVDPPTYGRPPPDDPSTSGSDSEDDASAEEEHDYDDDGGGAGTAAVAAAPPPREPSPPPSPPSAPPPPLLTEAQAYALRAAFDRAEGAPGGRARAASVAAALDGDRDVVDACGDRAARLAVGFLRTLGSDVCDYAAICEIVAHSAASRPPSEC